MRHSPFPSSSTVFGAGLLTAAVITLLAVLRWLEIPTGEWMDWLVGIGGFWWLLGVTTIPWNIYFGARHVLHEIKTSNERGIKTSLNDQTLAKKIATRSLFVAINLHVGSACIFAALAHYGITALGWFGALAAVLLTFAQPLTHLYRHLTDALRVMGNHAKFPREDFATLERRIDALEQQIRALDEHDSKSFAGRTACSIQRLEAQQIAHENSLKNAQKNMENLANKLSEDTQFLGHVRELIRFVKAA